MLDIRIAKLLRKYNLKGTFFISPKDRELSPTERLTGGEIKMLSKEFEIGAHTMTHPLLTRVEDHIAYKEILDSKNYLEKILHKPVRSFCYPGGFYKKKHQLILKKLGFKLSRTVSRFETETGSNLFAVPTTVHAYRHWSDIVPIFKNAGFRKFLSRYLNWDELAISMFDKIAETGGVFHLWGHSWEIEKNNDWERLERVFKHISNHANAKYITNGDVA